MADEAWPERIRRCYKGVAPAEGAMKCVVCHGESIETREVKEPIEVGSDVLYVRVTIPVCQTCGDRYYDRKTVKYLETVEAERWYLK